MINTEDRVKRATLCTMLYVSVFFLCERVGTAQIVMYPTVFVEKSFGRLNPSPRWYYKITSDRAVGAVGAGIQDATIMYPDSVLGRRYFVPGGFGGSGPELNAIHRNTVIRFSNFKVTWAITGSGIREFDSIGSATRNVPAMHHIIMDADLPGSVWYYPSHVSDGSGMLCESTQSFGMCIVGLMSLVNQIPHSVGRWWNENLPPESTLGCRYFFVPFTRETCVVGPAECLLRILFYHDQTELVMNGQRVGTAWQAGDVFDTLTVQAALITVSHPAAVYQHALDAEYYNCTSGSAAVLTLVPEEGWANTHWVFNRITMPHPANPRYSWSDVNRTAYPDYHRIAIVARNPAHVRLDGVNIDTTRFRAHGTYYYCDMEVSGEFTKIEAAEPIAVTCYGWMGKFAYAYSPPRK